MLTQVLLSSHMCVLQGHGGVRGGPGRSDGDHWCSVDESKYREGEAVCDHAETMAQSIVVPVDLARQRWRWRIDA